MDIGVKLRKAIRLHGVEEALGIEDPLNPLVQTHGFRLPRLAEMAGLDQAADFLRRLDRLRQPVDGNRNAGAAISTAERSRRTPPWSPATSY